MKIKLLCKGAEILNYRFAQFNKKYGKSLRTNFQEGEEVDAAYGSVIMGMDIKP